VKVIGRICGGSPLLVLVGNCDEDFRTQLLRFGDNRVMPKTDHPSELKNIIQNLYETNEPDLRPERVR
jgi:hypothetical protein